METYVLTPLVVILAGLLAAGALVLFGWWHGRHYVRIDPEQIILAQDNDATRNIPKPKGGPAKALVRMGPAVVPPRGTVTYGEVYHLPVGRRS